MGSNFTSRPVSPDRTVTVNVKRRRPTFSITRCVPAESFKGLLGRIGVERPVKRPST